MNNEVGYLYAFTKKAVRQELEPLKFINRLRDVKIEGDREYQKWIDLLRETPDASVEFKTVDLFVVRISRDSANDFGILNEQFPGFEVILLVNPTVHALIEKSGQYRSIGTIATNRIKALRQELSLYFVATPMESNRHLWPDDYWPKQDAPSSAPSASAVSYSAARGFA
jgi:hypothetical protein